MNKIRIVLFAAALLLSGQSFAQTTKATIQGEISISTANGLLGGTILNNIVLSYVDWTTCSGTGGIVYWNAGTPTCLNAGTNGYTLTMVSGIPQWTLPASQSANTVYAGPSSGSPATPSFRALVGSDLPNPSASTLGGVQSAAAVSHQWINSISTSGVPQLSQPAFTDISGTLAVSAGGTGATSAANAIINLMPTPTRAGDLAYWNGTNWVAFPGNNSGSQYLTENGSGVPSWSASASSGVTSVNGQTNTLTFYQTPQARLTLTQGTPVTTSDVTAATAVYLEPYNGGQITIYDGSVNWVPLLVASSTYSLPATQTQTCTLAGTITVTGCTDTSQMVVGEQVTGTNIPGSDTIASIVSSTSFTLANAATGSGSTSLTFKLPPNTSYDVYAINNSGVPKLVWSAAWSGTTPPTRALQNGVYVLSGTTTQRLLGSVYTSSIAGQLMDSGLCRCLSNLYNQVPRTLKLQESASTWTYSTGAWAQANSNTSDQIEIMFTVPGFAQIDINAMWSNSSSAGGNAWVGVGVDSQSVPSSTLTNCNGNAASGATNTCIAEYVGSPGIGPHYLAWLEYGVGTGTQTWYGTAGASDRIQGGMAGMVAN